MVDDFVYYVLLQFARIFSPIIIVCFLWVVNSLLVLLVLTLFKYVLKLYTRKLLHYQHFIISTSWCLLCKFIHISTVNLTIYPQFFEYIIYFESPLSEICVFIGSLLLILANLNANGRLRRVVVKGAAIE